MRYLIIVLLFTSYYSSAQTYMDIHIAQSVSKSKEGSTISNGQLEKTNNLISVILIREGDKQNEPTAGALEITLQDKSKELLHFTILDAYYDKEIGNGLEGKRDELTIKMKNEKYSAIKNISFFKNNGEMITIFIKGLVLTDILSGYGHKVE